MKTILRVTAIGLGVIIFGLILFYLRDGHKGHMHHNHPALTPAEGLGEIKEFDLVDQSGKKVTLEDLKGRYWLANFIFTRCQGPCPIISGRMAKLNYEYDDMENLTFVSFSVDPTFDTPERLLEYAKNYNADHEEWIFLTGDQDHMYDLIRNQFRLAVKDAEHIEKSPNEMDILHSLHFVLVNPGGKIEGFYNSNDPMAMKDLRIKLASLKS